MKNSFNIIVRIFVFLITLNSFCIAQVHSRLELGAKRDSVKSQEYPYVLPIFGEKATKAGFKLPYSAGVSLNYLWQESHMIMDNLQIGFNGSQRYNLDQIVRFNDAIARSNALNFRPDIWLFPFLNIYGIFAKSKTSTEVDFGIYVPNTDLETGDQEWNEIVGVKTKANFDAVSFGFGLTPTIGVAGAFLALDMSCTWTDIDALEKPAFAFIFGPRLGQNFIFNTPDMSLAVWVGGFRVSLASGTEGSLPLGDLFSTEELKGKIEQGFIKVSEGQRNIDAWWEGLNSFEQLNPINKAKYAAGNKALETAGNILNTASSALSSINNSTVEYSLEKKQANKWNFIVGSQFQLNKNWMFRAEYGFLAQRVQFIGGIQYRFGL